MFDISKCPKDKDGNRRAQTRDGRPVTLITTQGREPWPVVGYIGGCNSLSKWGLDGKFTENMDRETDLTNIPEPKRSGEVWVHIVESDSGRTHSVSSPWRDFFGNEKVISRFSYKWTEGEGLEGK